VIRVVLADDQALVRAGFRALLDAEPDIEVVGEASDGRTPYGWLSRNARRDAHGHQDAGARRPGRHPPDRRRPLAVRGTHHHPHHLRTRRAHRRGATRGAAGFLVKTTDPAELVRGVHVVAAGEGLLSPSITRRVIEQFAAHGASPAPPRQLADLTDREREVVALAGAGLSNDEIAARLVVSPATAKTNVSRAMVKLGARGRAQLVVFAYEAGLVRPGWLPRPDR
jgi:DNA-binding NarL/FixJ family response regulator